MNHQYMIIRRRKEKENKKKLFTIRLNQIAKVNIKYKRIQRNCHLNFDTTTTSHLQYQSSFLFCCNKMK